MKKSPYIIKSLFFCLGWQTAIASTAAIDWFNPAVSTMIDSSGSALTSSEFTFQLGTFDSITPNETNVSQFETEWRVFDEASYNQVVGHFTSTANLDEDGFSNGTNADASYDFSNKDAYLWIYNRQDVVEYSTEWFLGRVADWVFPDVTGVDCCGGSFNLMWSLETDFDSADPGDVDVVWGGHSFYVYEGGGSFTPYGSDFLSQTYIVIPEPGTWMMMGLTLSAFGVCLFFRRKHGEAK